MAEPLRHRQTKEAETDMFSLQPPRHISTLHIAADANASYLRPVFVGQRSRMEARRRPNPALMTPSRHEAGRNLAVQLCCHSCDVLLFESRTRAAAALRLDS